MFSSTSPIQMASLKGLESSEICRKVFKLLNTAGRMLSFKLAAAKLPDKYCNRRRAADLVTWVLALKSLDMSDLAVTVAMLIDLSDTEKLSSLMAYSTAKGKSFNK